MYIYKHTYTNTRHTNTHTLILLLLVVVSILCKQCGWQIGGKGEGYIEAAECFVGVY